MRNQTDLPAGPRRKNGPREAAERLANRPRGARPTLDIPIEVGGLGRLRRAVSAHAGRLGAGETHDDIVLVAHELATNVVRHGGGTGRLRLWREGGRMICQVSDSGPGFGPTDDELPGPEVAGGRGLWIARRLAEVRIETGSSGTVVVAMVKLPRNL